MGTGEPRRRADGGGRGRAREARAGDRAGRGAHGLAPGALRAGWGYAVRLHGSGDPGPRALPRAARSAPCRSRACGRRPAVAPKIRELMRKLILVLAVVSLAALAAAGCGKEEVASSASSLVPAEAVFFGEVTLRPDGDQKAAVDAIVSKFPGQGRAGDRLQVLIDKALRESGGPALSYKDDIEPWLGDEAAFFVAAANMQEGAALIATDDDDQARQALEKAAEGKLERRSYKDVEYLLDQADGAEAGAVFDGFLVLGSEAGVKAVIDTSKGGKPLSDDESYSNAIDDAADDRLGLFYVNSPQLLKDNTSAAAGVPENFKKVFEEPTVATIDADSDGIVFESSLPQQTADAIPFLGQGSKLLTELPADAWLAMAQPDFDKTLDFFVEAAAGFAGGRDVVEQQFEAATGLDLQKDVLDWMGDFGVFARGTSVSDLDGALVIETSNEAASGRFISALERLAEGQADDPGDRVGPLTAPAGGNGFTLTGRSFPTSIHVFQRSGRVVLAYGDKAAADAVGSSQPLGDSPDYEQAAGSLGDYDVSFYLAVAPILQLVDSTSAAGDADWRKAKPYLEPLSALLGGTSGDGDGLRSAF